MRNALICVGVMTALLLLWPLAFGTRSSADAATVRIEVPPVAR